MKKKSPWVKLGDELALSAMQIFVLAAILFVIKI